MTKKLFKFLSINLIMIFSFIIFNSHTDAWYLPYGSITVYYTDIDGNELHEKDFLFGKIGNEYEITIPQIENYTTDIDTISGIFEGDIEKTIIYNKINEKYTLTIHYLDESNNNLFDDDIYEYNYNDEYNINIKQIDGYNTLTDTLEGTILNNEEINVIYYKNTYSLTINYVDKCNNILKTYTYEYKYLDNYNINIESIEGYKTDTTNVSGTIKENTTIYVVFIAEYVTLTIHYIDSFGNKILCDSIYYVIPYNYYIISVPRNNWYMSNSIVVYVTENMTVNVVLHFCYYHHFIYC